MLHHQPSPQARTPNEGECWKIRGWAPYFCLGVGSTRISAVLYEKLSLTESAGTAELLVWGRGHCVSKIFKILNFNTLNLHLVQGYVLYCLIQYLDFLG